MALFSERSVTGMNIPSLSLAGSEAFPVRVRIRPKGDNPETRPLGAPGALRPVLDVSARYRIHMNSIVFSVVQAMVRPYRTSWQPPRYSSRGSYPAVALGCIAVPLNDQIFCCALLLGNSRGATCLLTSWSD